MGTSDTPDTRRTVEPAPPRPVAARGQVDPAVARRGARTAKNMIWALLACLVPVGLISLVVLPHQKPAAAPVVDWQQTLTQARSSAPYRLLGPDPLPTGWRATSARYGAPVAAGSPTTWHLGVLTTEQQYVGLEQSDGTAGPFLFAQLGATRADGTRTISGVVWRQYVLTDRPDNPRALVRTVSGVTTLVEGIPSYDVLAGYVATLR